MVITKREILVSVIMVCLLLCLGLFIDSKIVEGQTLSKEKYNKALKIDNNNNMFKYAIKTNIGNIINYGKFKVDKGVNSEWLKNDYMYINKIAEEYTRHYKIVCSGSGKTRSCHTKTYYTWDKINSQVSNVTTLKYSGLSFNFNEFENYPTYRLELNKDTVIDNKVDKIKNNCIYETIRTFGSDVGDKRYLYEVVNKNFSGTVFGTAKNNKFTDGRKLTINAQNIKQFIRKNKNNYNTGRIVFWILYIVIGGCGIGCYLYLENDYLED
jgi:hypothetical protein|nr:MAG TPA: hypothetical protein [Caudoviricetes sp.]